jgi:outer membrane murein-binding lipoprotein Lpp
VRLFLAFLVMAVMAGAASAAGMYRWQEVRYMQITAEQRVGLEAQVEDLAAEVQTLQQRIAQLTGTEDPTTAAETACEVNADAPSTTVPFTHERSGVTFDIPYNPAWGTGEIAPEPYVLLSGIDGVLFGRPRPTGVCEWAHTLQLTVIPARTSEAIATDLGERMGIPIERSTPELLLTEEAFGEHTFLSYRVAGACLLQNYELQLDELNVIFSTCIEDTEDLKEVLPSVVRS